MSAENEKAFTVFLHQNEFAVTAERFTIDEGVLKFFAGSTQVAAFNSWDGVI